jgi:hypothetical protein
VSRVFAPLRDFENDVATALAGKYMNPDDNHPDGAAWELVHLPKASFGKSDSSSR